MSIAPQLKKYLEKEKITYQILEHPEAFTATEIAGVQHIPGKQLIKSVLVKADGQFLLCVLPATHRINLEKLKKVAKAKNIQLATEAEIAKLFPDYEVGAEPPFGNLYGISVFAEKQIGSNEEIVFNAGTHTETIKIKWQDFNRVTKPTLETFGEHV